LSDADLIQRARQGDESAYEVLVGEHQQAIFRLAYLLLGDPGEAQDIAQETFIRAFRALDRFDTTRPLRPWLMRITTNLARNQRRSVGRYLAALQRMVSADPDRFGSTNLDDNQKWEHQALWESVKRLDRNDQEIIYLRYFMELSEAETAETLAIAPGTVKSRLHRALGRLRTIIGSKTIWEGGER
jgi:RNA polymerase sigma-70 factor (ECF subfamily)